MDHFDKSIGGKGYLLYENILLIDAMHGSLVE
jgi:hypothetical protein